MSRKVQFVSLILILGTVIFAMSRDPAVDPNAPDPDTMKKLILRNSQDVEFLHSKIDSLQALLSEQLTRGSGVEARTTVGYSDEEASRIAVAAPTPVADTDDEKKPVDWPAIMEEPEVREQFREAVYTWIDKKKKDEARQNLDSVFNWLYAVDIQSTPKKLKLSDIQKEEYAHVIKKEHEEIQRIARERYASVDRDGKDYKPVKFAMMETAARKKTMEAMKAFMDPAQFKQFKASREKALKNYNKNRNKRSTEIGRLNLEAVGR